MSKLKIKNQDEVLFLIALVLACLATFVRPALPQDQKKCGKVILEGYFITHCPISAIFSLSKEDCPYKSGRCDLDIWLSEIDPKKNYQEAVNDACSNKAKECPWPLTSSLFVMPFLGYYPVMNEEIGKVTLIGDYKKIKVCFPIRKCLEPECGKCEERDVFIPCEIIQHKK